MAESVKKKIRVKGQILKNEIMIIPTCGVINERQYYGYPVIAISFGWLCFRGKVEFGVKIVRF